MSNPSDAAMSRRQLLQVAATAAAVTTGLAGLGAAATPSPGATAPAPDQVSFKANLAGDWDGFLIPLNPPVVADRQSATGQADLLGQVTFVGHHFVQLNVAGIPQAVTDGLGVLAAANGDALFISWSGLVHRGATEAELAFVVTGGRGRFLGATGSGVRTDMVTRTSQPSKSTFVSTIEATLLLARSG